MNSRYGLVADRASHRCEYCHAPEALFNFPFEVEHIIPPSRDGTDDDENLALACLACNLFKSDRIDAKIPNRQMLSRSFTHALTIGKNTSMLTKKTGVIVGVTPTGRATVEQLKLNSSLQLSARCQWMRLGLFP